MPESFLQTTIMAPPLVRYLGTEPKAGMKDFVSALKFGK